MDQLVIALVESLHVHTWPQAGIGIVGVTALPGVVAQFP